MELFPDAKLFCFKHCRDAAVQFYTASTQPSACEHCGRALSLGCTLEPFQVPCPWYTGQALRPGTMLLKMLHRRTQAYSSKKRRNRGYFLGEEQQQKQLTGSFHSSQLQCSHIGIADGSGSVYHFNHEGLRLDHLGSQDGPRSWHGALLIEVGGGSPYMNDQTVIEDVAKAVELSGEWSAERYCPKTHNCLDFIIAMLNELVAHTSTTSDYGSTEGASSTSNYVSKDAFFSRERIARQLLVPALQRSHKYLRILRIACADIYRPHCL